MRATRSSTRAAWSSTDMRAHSSGGGDGKPAEGPVRSVLRLRRVDLTQVGEYAALDVRDVGEPRAQGKSRRLRRAGPHLAVDEHPSVRRQLVERLAGPEAVEMDRHRTRDARDRTL